MKGKNVAESGVKNNSIFQNYYLESHISLKHALRLLLVYSDVQGSEVNPLAGELRPPSQVWNFTFFRSCYSF